MTDKPKTALTPQQVNDAQYLDDITSLQHLLISEKFSTAPKLSYPASNTLIQQYERYFDVVNLNALVWTRDTKDSSIKDFFQVHWVFSTLC